MFYEEDKGFDVEYQRIFPVKNSTTNTRFFYFFFFYKKYNCEFFAEKFFQVDLGVLKYLQNLICGLYTNIFYM